MSLIVGLTGGVGCGKSTVSQLFQRCGAPVIDTDEIAHRLSCSGGEAIAALRATFGDEYITAAGALDRAKMRTLVFSDAHAKRRLEGLLHPLILRQVGAQLGSYAHQPYVLLVVPLLLESPDFMALVQRILVVDCRESQQLDRVMLRSQLSAEQVRAIMSSQVGREVRLAAAQDVIHNDGELANLSAQVQVLHARYILPQRPNGD